MIKLVLWILLLAGISYASLCLYLYLRQRSLLYFPHPETYSTEAEPFWLENDGQRLKIWNVERAPGPALIYFGGNAEDVSANLPFLKAIIPDFSLYLMNYRGFGGSSGSPTETALYADSLALYDNVRQNHDQIIVMGRSLGTGIATYLASRRAVSRLVLVTPYSSMATLAAGYYPFMPVSPLIKDRYDSQEYAADITAPTLTLTAENDEIIPRRISEDLVNAFRPGMVKNIIITQTGHNDIEQSPSYRSHLDQFLNSEISKGAGEP